MAEQKQGAEAKPKKKTSLLRILLIVGVVVLVVIVAAGFYLASLLKSVHVAPPVHAAGKSNASLTVIGQDMLSTANLTQAVPYLLASFNARNTTDLFVTAQLLSERPPTSVYLLNSSNECFSCGSIPAFSAALSQQLSFYGIFNRTNGLQLVSPGAGALLALPNDSVLIIPNGYLPDVMLSNVSGIPVLTQLMVKGITVIYIGRNFSKLITSQSVLILDQNQPPYLDNTPAPPVSPSGFFFSDPTFKFSPGSTYGPITYVTVGPGHILAFSNYLNTWASPSDAASDISLALSQVFWIQQYTEGYGSANITSLNSSSGIVGVSLDQSPLSYSNASESTYSSSYGRLILESSNDSFRNASGTTFRLEYFKPEYKINGTISMPSIVFPGMPVTAEMQIYTSVPIQVEPHLDIYTQNLQLIESLSPFFSKSINSSYIFFNTFTLNLPPGTYLAKLDGFSGQHYASATFSVPSVELYLQGVNQTLGTYTFSAYAGPLPLNNVTANISLNGKYPEKVLINNGGFTYQLPFGVQSPTGNLTFTVNAFGQSLVYPEYYSPPTVTINKQYIEFIIAIIIVILEITLVKAPIRDDFYIDVPSMPQPKQTNIKIKSNELLSVFDKLNLYYHWRFMPLSNSEFRIAISSNIRSNGMPVTLTHSNIDIMLDNLVSSGALVGVDGLYAPKAWIEQSKHDVEYLATFKKMRVYLVSHAHIFTDLDKSDVADIVTTLHNEKAFIVIYSSTSRFVRNIPVQPPIKTYLAFLNQDKLDEFRNSLYESSSRASEELKMYISTGSIVLIDADNPEGILT